MARKQVTVCTCNMCSDGLWIEESKVTSVKLEVNGVLYDMDLCKTHERMLMPLLAKADVVQRNGRKGGDVTVKPDPKAMVLNGNGRGPAKIDKHQREAIREWAGKMGKPIAKFGRIAPSVIAEFNAAGGIVQKPVPASPEVQAHAATVKSTATKATKATKATRTRPVKASPVKATRRPAKAAKPKGKANGAALVPAVAFEAPVGAEG